MRVSRPASTLGRRLAGGTVACVLGLAVAPTSWAAPPAAAGLPVGAQPQDIDRLAARIQEKFAVPGMAVAIVKDGKVLFAKGYGVRETGKSDRVDSNTLFGIGSNTKAFTVAALAMLLDEGKLSWDDKVIDRLPSFRLSDALRDARIDHPRSADPPQRLGIGLRRLDAVPTQ